jgi:SWI/SNF-related matrix-associated actin-dependent regulator 1 of chromatin subfamily A
MELIYNEEQGRYDVISGYAEREIPKAAGCRWDGERKRWWTTEAHVAEKLAEFAKEPLKARLLAAVAQKQASLSASRATDAEVALPCPAGLEYLPFQKAGIAYAMERPATLFADEMGLGKTVQAVGVINTDPTIKRVLVVCPASLRLNWKRELERWLTRPLIVGVVTAREMPAADILVVNYDVLHKWPELAQTTYDLLIVDEVHYCKNPKTRRSKLTYAFQACRRLFLTGTPIVNRPKELYPIIRALDPQTWPSFMGFARRYCDAYQDRYGWNFDGASNLEELQARLRSTVMVRRLKKDVLSELPAKRRQVIEVSANGAAGVVAQEQAAWANYQEQAVALKTAVELAKAADDPEEYKAAVEKLREGMRVAFTEMSRVRHEVALAKVPEVVAHVNEMLESGAVEKVLVFCHHRDVAQLLKVELAAYNPLALTGDTPLPLRQSYVDTFQTDPHTQVFIGNIQAAGVGLTLTAASHVVFAELDWVPGNVTQAEDRAHRIGQTNSVLVQHLVLEGSLDARMAKTLVEKQGVIDRALDKGDTTLLTEPLLPLPATTLPATQHTSPQEIAAEAPTLSAAQIEAVHAGLLLLAGMCDGAQALDGTGFSKIDARIGKALAAVPTLTPRQAALGLRLVTRYGKKQLPPELVAAAKGGA